MKFRKIRSAIHKKKYSHKELKTIKYTMNNLLARLEDDYTKCN